VPYPELIPGCTSCGACLLVCPDFCFEIYRYEEPVTHGSQLAELQAEGTK
jgi:2-oxoglutarate ferredoxin oxidoreductase subunit delta